jgi:hypothetical protein
VVHDWPAVHALHVPCALQTWLVPQLVPADLSVPSVQTCAPEAHEVTPFAQTLFGLVVHDSPAVHATHWPLPLHTWFVPHEVPACFFVPSVQTCAPEAQEVMPV